MLPLVERGFWGDIWRILNYKHRPQTKPSSKCSLLTTSYLKLAMFSTEAEQMITTDHSCRFAQVKATDGRALLYPEIKPDQIVGLYSLTLGM